MLLAVLCENLSRYRYCAWNNSSTKMGLSAGDIEKILDVKLSAFKEEIIKELERNIDKRIKEGVRSEILVLETSVQKVNEKLKALETENSLLKASFDRHEQSSRNLNLRIFGVQQKESEEDLQKILLDIFGKANCNVRAGDIKNCYRITAKNKEDNKRLTRSQSGGSTAAISDSRDNKPPAILVRFNMDGARNNVFKKRKQLDALGIRIREDLTKHRLSLLAKAVENSAARMPGAYMGTFMSS